MKRNCIVLFLFIPCFYTALAQGVTANRQRVIAILLLHSNFKTTPAINIPAANVKTPAAETVLSNYRIETIPRYCLPKGAIVCRLEEYVQLHSPLKLNIGLGGE